MNEYPVLAQLLDQSLVVVARRLAPEHAERRAWGVGSYPPGATAEGLTRR
jgi:hypothetical protein